MRLITLLNHCQHFPGFVYEKARLCPESSTIEIRVRPRRGSKPVCSGCHKPATGYDQLSIRRFEFVPFWGFMVLLIYRMRRVDCRACGVRVEELPWAIGKHQLTKAYMLFLAHWARKLSWQETAVAFRSTWDKVCQAVEYVVEWGLEHRNLGPIQAIGVDEIRALDLMDEAMRKYPDGHIRVRCRAGVFADECHPEHRNNDAPPLQRTNRAHAG